MHFPRVCELLHFMLTKALPEEYERRGQDIQGMEEEKQVFSPRFLESPRHAWSPRKEDDPDKVTSQLPLLPASLTTSVSNLSLRNDNASSCLPRPAASTIPGYQPKIDHPTNLEDVQNLLTVEDFLCCSCSKFLYRPVVLNCGEVSIVRKPSSRRFSSYMSGVSSFPGACFSHGVCEKEGRDHAIPTE